MKTEKIEELFENHSPFRTLDYSNDNVMDLEDFTGAINQAELEWYKKLESHLSQMIERENFAYDVRFYCEEIQNKIKELENDNENHIRTRIQRSLVRAFTQLQSADR
jgi:DUF438 domain-containing protein